MKTYMTISFDSEGAKPSEVVERLAMLGFKPAQGNYDFVYDWGSNNDSQSDVGVDDAVWFADKVHATLRGSKVLFTLETI
jgi:hypothetical protein